MSRAEQVVVDKEIQEMLRKRGPTNDRAIPIDNLCRDEKRKEQFRPIINLKHFNRRIIWEN